MTRRRSWNVGWAAVLLVAWLGAPVGASGQPPPQLTPDPEAASDPLAGVSDLIDSGKWTEAQTRIQEALPALRALGDREGEAAAFLLLGKADMEVGDPAASSHLAEAAERFATLGDDLGCWMALLAQGTLEMSEGRFDAAVAFHERALASMRAAAAAPEKISLGGFKLLASLLGMPVDGLEQALLQPELKPALLLIGEAIFRVSYGGVLVEAGRLDEAEIELQRAADHSVLFGGQLDFMLDLYRGDLRRRQWRLDEARQSYRKALASAKLLSLPGAQGTVILEILSKLALLEPLAGRFDEALAWNQSALALVRRQGPAMLEAHLLEERAIYQWSSQRLVEAEVTLAEALAVAEKASNLSRQASIRTDSALLRMSQGRYGEAAAELEQAVYLYRQVHSPIGEAWAWVLLSRASRRLAAHSDNDGGADSERARDLARRSGPHLAEALGQMIGSPQGTAPGAASAQREAAQLIEFFELPEAQALLLDEDVHRLLGQALSIDRSGPAELQALVYLFKGKLLFDRGEFAPAREPWRKALEGALSQELRAGFLAAIGASYWREGDVEEAVRSFAQAVGAAGLSLDDVRTEELLVPFLGKDEETFFQLAIETLVRQGRAAEAFEQAERARARAFLRQLDNRRLDPDRGVGAPLAREAEALRLQILAWQRKAIFVSPRQREQRSTDLQHARQRHQALLARLAADSPEYASLTGLAAVQVHAVQEALPPDTALLSYFVSPRQVHAWILDRGTFHHEVLRLAAVDLRRAACWADALAHGASGPGCDGRATAEQLYDQLIAPLRRRIRHSRLVVVAHGELRELPFAALRNPQTGRYLIEDYTLSYAPSAGALGFRRTRETPPAGQALVLGAPPLPAAEQQAVAVAWRLHTEPRLGPRATESLLVGLGGRVGLLHIAARAVYEPADSLLSHLVLAPGEGQDGNLATHEVLAGLDLSGVGLVVLSGCCTAAGERDGGAGAASLARAFLYAGSAGVLSSAWDVGGDASSAFLDEFYRRLLGGASAAEALRQAQLALLRDPRHGSPSNWAAFRLMGDPQARWPRTRPEAADRPTGARR